jgi:hypothetical protein
MVRRAGFEPARGRVLNPPPLPIGLPARARGGLRTCTLPEFKAGPLPVGLHEHGAPGGIRTRHCPGSKPSASYQLGYRCDRLSNGAARGHRTPDLSHTKGELCQLSYDGKNGSRRQPQWAPKLEPQPGIEHGSAAYKAAASAMLQGRMVLAGRIEHPASALRERRSTD